MQTSTRLSTRIFESFRRVFSLHLFNALTTIQIRSTDIKIYEIYDSTLFYNII